jgi:hypothetical protein
MIGDKRKSPLVDNRANTTLVVAPYAKGDSFFRQFMIDLNQ